MKKSRMIKHIAAKMCDAYRDRQLSRDTEDAYWKREATNLLDMLEGFGMLPPTRYYNGEPPLTSEMPVKSNTWDPE